MANYVQIPNLPAAIALSGTEQFESVQAGVSVRVTAAQITTYAIAQSAGLANAVAQATAAAAAAAASADDADASAAAAAAAEAAAQAAQTIATEVAAAIANVIWVLDWQPGVVEPDVQLLDNTLGIVWTARTEQARLDVVYAAGFFSFLLDWQPGVPDSSSPWILDITAGILVEPANSTGGANAANVASTRNVTTLAAVPNELATRVSLIGKSGQSLAQEGGNYTPALVAASPLAPGKILMPSVGLAPGGQLWSAPIDAVDQYYNNSNLSQGSNPTGAVYSMSVALYNTMYSLINAQTGIIPIIFGMGHGLGGTSITNLGPGTTSGENFLNDMQRARDWAQSQGLTIYMPYYIWIHGNADLGSMSNEQYARWLILFQRWVTASARRIFGQVEEVIFYIEQCTVAQETLGAIFPVVESQLDLPVDEPVLFRFLPPAYDLVHPDGTHLDSWKYHIRNQRHANIIYSDLFGGGFPTLCVSAAWWTSATTIRCQINLYKQNLPLVRDISLNSSTVTITIASPGVVTWNAHGLTNGTRIYLETTGALPTGYSTAVPFFIVNAATNTFQLAATSGGSAIITSGSQSGVQTAIAGGDGIQFTDGSVSPPYVTTISIVDPGTTYGIALVDVNISAPPAAVGQYQLFFGQLTGPGATGQGWTGGARTTLRDSSAAVSDILPDGSAGAYPLYTWLGRQAVVVT